MKSLLALAAFVVVAHGASLDLNSEWELFKANFERNFISQPEHDLRKAVFADNLRLINQHNAEYALGLHTYTLGVNKFADMTNQEFVKKYNKFVTPAADELTAQEEGDVDISDLPDMVDWRTKGYVTPVKNQAQCGSCWAFSAVVTMEGAHFKKTGKLVSLSEQNLVDCVKQDGGCNGGFPKDGVKYAIKHGIDTEASYPYTARDGHCHFKKKNVGATFTAVKVVKKGSEKALQKAVATVGPVSVGIDASHYSFQLYNSGIYNEPSCSATALDHGVAIVGYGSEDGKDYYIVKNSWGSGWGEEGYIKMQRNHHNRCGIATMACYAIA